MSLQTSDSIASISPVRTHRFQRLRRLAIKELREILRDRRTLVTLVLMPFLLYPLFSIVLRKFMFTGDLSKATPLYFVACDTTAEAQLMRYILDTSRPLLKQRSPDEDLPEVTLLVADPKESQGQTIVENSEDALRGGTVDLVVRITKLPAQQVQMDANWEMDCELVAVQGSLAGERAARYVEDSFRVLGNIVIAQRLRAVGIQQRPSPVRAIRKILKERQTSSVVSLSALIPFVLILMTITGAVYPAIDLTAGERERGTLELLIAAPVPRLSLLFAKYIAVLAVAMLTATVNLVAMTATIALSGLGPLLWGQRGLTVGTVISVFGLLFLLASFFSAILLAITSFARSFKEAQAYLIPLMLCALGPGLISLMPGVELSGWLLVTPLLNVSLLSRDLLSGQGSLLSGIVVVISTALYAFGALAIATKLFAAEAVFYDARINWQDLWKRPSKSRKPSIAQALLCLACMFPVSFAALGGIGTATNTSLTFRFALMVIATALVYGGVPLIFAYWGRVDWRTGLSWRAPPWTSLFGAALLGLSLWPFAHEIVVISQSIGFASLEKEQIERAQGLIDQAREIPIWLFLAAIAIAPACFEEFCFRGFIFGAFRVRLRPWGAVLVTGLMFGLFHLVTSDALAVERLIPSTALGCVLGWVCWRTGSIFPGIVLHATHNGFLALVIYYLEELKARGWGIDERSHLPATWLMAAFIGGLVGFFVIWFSRRRDLEGQVLAG